MPPAVAITMPSPQVSPALSAHAAVGAASVSDADFGKLFREKAGAVPVPVPATAALKSREAGAANLNLPADPETETSTEGSASVTATSILPGAASPDFSTVLYPAHPQNENTSHLSANIDLKASLSNSSAVPSTARTSESESRAPIQSQLESPELSTPNQSAHAQKAKQPAEVAKKTDAPRKAKEAAVSLGRPQQFLLPSALSSSVQPSASVAGDPSPAAPHQSGITSAAIRKNSFGLTGNSQSLSAQQNATTPSSAQKSPLIAENQAETLASDSASRSASQRPALGSVESAASFKETAPQNALAAHSGATQPGDSAAGFIANAASPAIPAWSPTGGSPGSALPQNPAVPAAPAAAPAPTPAPNLTPNLYDRIDQGSAPALLHSGAQHVAVGVRDSDLGWVEIRTQNMAGHVDATLVTASGQTHATLAAQLPAISEFLQQRDVRLGTLAVQHQAPGMNAGSGQSGSGSGPSQSGSGHPQQNGQAANASISRTLPAAVAPPGQEGAAFRPVSYISVRA